MAGTYGEPGKNTFAIPGVGGILSPVVNDTTGVTQVYRGGAATTQKSLGTFNPTTNKFTPDTNAGLTPSEIKALSSEANLKTLKDKASETVSKGVQAAGGTPEKGQAAANKLLSPNKADNPDTSGDNSTPFNPESFSKNIQATKGTRDNFKQNGVLTYPIDIGTTKQDVIKFDMLKYKPKKFDTENFGFSARERNFDSESIGTVVLPIPSGISDNNAANWSDATMNAAEAELANVALSSITGGGGSGGDALTKAAEKVSKNAGEVKTAVAAVFADSAVGTRGLLTRTTGAIINPNLELLFNAPTLRSFSFTFKMSARSAPEAKTIISILRFFKQGMSPQRSDSNLFLKSPHTFKIRYLHRGREGEEHKYIGKIKECALQSFVVNYTPEGQYATFYDGVLVSYEIQMTFQELEPIFNDDYTKDDFNDIGF